MPDVFEKDKGGITLKIKINPRFLERLFFITIIITLSVFLFLDVFCDASTEVVSEEETQQATTTTTEETTQEIEEQEETSEVEDQVVEEINETVEELVVNETVEEVIEYSGKVLLTINEVIHEMKNNGTYAKITSVRFTINNEKDDFMPKVEVYTYEDGDTSSIFATKPREERIYSTLKFPAQNSYELDIASQQFTDMNDAVIVKVIVKDKSTDDELVMATEKVILV